MPCRATWLTVAALGLLTACGGGSDEPEPPPSVPAVGPRPTVPAQPDAEAVVAQGTVTKNTSRLAGADATEAAAAVALAVYPSRAPDLRPTAVAVADAGDWHAAISAGALMSAPLRAPLLLSAGGALDGVAGETLQTLGPTGAEALGGATVLPIGTDAASPTGQRVEPAAGPSPAATGAAVDELLARVTGSRSRDVIVAGAGDDAAAFAMPAAGLAAKTGAPVLWTDADALPDATRDAITERRRPRIFVVGPPAAVGEDVVRRLRELGRVERIGAGEPVAHAVEIARFSQGAFGWGVVDPGHGVVFARGEDPALAGAAAPLSGSGKYGPLVLVQEAGVLPRPVESYLLDIQPGFDTDPVRGVYNHGWVIGDAEAIGPDVQARIDGLMEIQPVAGD